MRHLVLIFFFILPFSSFGQAIELPKILPPSPNAASLGDYGQVPVGLFTGTPQVNIPLYELNEGRLKVPIGLHYSSNGIRVDEIASNVGLGWSLNAGGIITRVIRDDADESYTLPLPSNFPDGFTQEILTYLENATDPESGYDTFSDLYSFNFNGYSGKFYLSESRQPILISPSPLKIEKTPNSYFAFKVTDPSGIVYWFGNQNATETSMYQHIGTGQHGWSLESPTSWYLSKIESPFGEQLDFTYNNFNKIYFTSLSQSVVRQADGQHSGVAENLIQTRSNTAFAQLSSIVSSNGQIDFSYAPNTSGFDQLDSIEIKKSDGSLVKKFNLDYQIVSSSLVNLKNLHIPYLDAYEKRLFLSSVIEEGTDGLTENPYLLSYYNPDELPPRFSYAQDYWGYFNGVTTNEYLVSEDDYFFEENSNTLLLHSIFSDLNGDKKPNGSFGVNGLLKKIIYPTKGYNELFYEPHSYYGTQLIPPPSTSVGLHPNGHLESCDDDWPVNEMTKSITIGPIPFTHSSVEYPELFNEVKVPIYISAGTTPCWECDGSDWPNQWIRGSLAVVNANTGGYEKLYHKISADVFIEVSQPYVFLESGNQSQLYADLEEGKTYTFIAKVFRECVRADISFSYYDELPQEVDTNIEVGGLRLQKVITSEDNNIEQVKNYHYGDFSCLDCSSGITDSPRPAITYTKETTDTWGNIWHEVDILTLSSSTLYDLYSKQGHQIGYPSVIEEIGNDFSGGGIFHEFMISPNILPTSIFGLNVPGTPFTTSFGTGEELQTQSFKKSNGEYITLKKTLNSYYNNPILNQEQSLYGIRLRDVFTHLNSQSLTEKIQSFDIMEYLNRSQWHYLSSSITKQYDQNGENPIETTTSYVYDNPDHLQPTKVITTTSDNKTIVTTTDYPHDAEVSGDPYMSNLRNANRIAEPIQVKQYRGDGTGGNLSLLNTQKTEYNDFSGLILPKTVKVAKGDVTTSNPLEDRLIYHSYDGKGNIREVSKADGTRIVYVMGYDFTLPVAKLENTTVSVLNQTLLDAIYVASGTGGTENDLLLALADLRSTLPNAQVTTYTYKPLIGASTVTDPGGYIMTYHYDQFNRLEYVKDQQGNVLSETEYNFKN